MIRNIVIAIVAVAVVGGGWYASGYEDRKAQAAYERSQAAREAAERIGDALSDTAEPATENPYSHTERPVDEPTCVEAASGRIGAVRLVPAMQRTKENTRKRQELYNTPNPTATWGGGHEERTNTDEQNCETATYEPPQRTNTPPTPDPTPTRTYSPAAPEPEPEPRETVAVGGSVPAGTWGCWQYLEGVSMTKAGYWGSLVFDGSNGYTREGVGSGTYSLSGGDITFQSGTMTDYTGEYPDENGYVRVHGKPSADLDNVHAVCSRE